MQAQPIPPQFEHLAHRPFAFYPPILNIEHNEWTYRRSNWSEILVANRKTGEEIWVPWRFLGEISRIEEPVMIVGLEKELEYRSGLLTPHERRVIEIPRATSESAPARGREEAKHAPAASIRLENSAETRIGRLIGTVLVIGILACFVVVSLFRGAGSGQRVRYVGVVQSDLGLTPNDDYWAVVRLLGKPASEQWRSEEGELQYQVMRYPDRGLFIILMGKDRPSARYIGALDKNWKPVHSVDLPKAGNTRSMLSTLKRF